MNIKSTIPFLCALFCWTAALPVMAQHADAGIDVFSFFDNSEGNNAYREALTHAGIRITPKIGISTDDSIHRIVGGYSFVYDYGDKKIKDGDVELYYQYKKDNLRVLFGCFPRTLMYEEMPEYLICDSIKYYRPEFNGFDFLYTTEHGHLEAFCDWTQLRGDNEREQFMAGLSTRFILAKRLQIGLEGHLYHYALEWGSNSANHFIHEVITGHPFVGMLIGNPQKDLHIDLRAGALIQADRDRMEGKWHVPVGFVGDIDGKLWRFRMHETLYLGKRQQQFGNQGFGKYYWGDTFLQSPWYSRTDLGYCITSHNNAQLETKLVFNVTDRGLQWHQMLTLRCNIDFIIK